MVKIGTAHPTLLQALPSNWCGAPVFANSNHGKWDSATSCPGHGSKPPCKTICVRHPPLQTDLSHQGVQTRGEMGLLPRHPCCPHRHMPAAPHPGFSHFCQVEPSFWPLGSWHHTPSKEKHCPNGVTQAPKSKTHDHLGLTRWCTCNFGVRAPPS